MVLTVADVERWSAGAVRDVFHAATARGNATLEASRQLSTLSVFDSWDGATAEARKHTNASIRQDLDAHGQESLAVAQAAGKAADDIEKVQSELRTLQHDASELHMTVNSQTNQVVPSSSFTRPLMEAEIAEMQLQPRLDAIVAEANTVDAELPRRSIWPRAARRSRPGRWCRDHRKPDKHRIRQTHSLTIRDSGTGKTCRRHRPTPEQRLRLCSRSIAPSPTAHQKRLDRLPACMCRASHGIGDIDAPAAQGQEQYRFKLADHGEPCG